MVVHKEEYHEWLNSPRIPFYTLPVCHLLDIDQGIRIISFRNINLEISHNYKKYLCTTIYQSEAEIIGRQEETT